MGHSISLKRTDVSALDSQLLRPIANAITLCGAKVIILPVKEGHQPIPVKQSQTDVQPPRWRLMVPTPISADWTHRLTCHLHERMVTYFRVARAVRDVSHLLRLTWPTF